MTQSDSGSMPLRGEHDIVMGRQTVRRLTQQIGFSLVDQTKMITAASELSRNTVVYGGGGEMRWEFVEVGSRRGLRLHFQDQGPGIADVKLALTDGWTSGKGLGFGRPGSKRVFNDLEIRSSAGEGTCVSVTRWK